MYLMSKFHAGILHQVQRVIMFYCCPLLNQMVVGLNIGLHVCHDIQCKAAFFLLILSE